MATNKTLPDRHLDLGCGSHPRNPYARSALFGVDIGEVAATARHVEIAKANLSLQPIPFPDDHFASVSAYDFLEHVPRVLPTPDGQATRFPFIELMNEIWRVLAPGGLFYAVTPAYPHPTAFQDPTHVNIITAETQEYFTAPRLLGRMYGYHGTFELVRQCRVRPRGDYEPVAPSLYHRWRRARQALMSQSSHLVWELQAVKEK